MKTQARPAAAGPPTSSIAAKRSTALGSAAAGPRLSSTSGTRPLDPLRRIGASRVSLPLPPHLRTPKSRARRGPPGAVLDTARAGRAPSRSSGSGLPSSASPLGKETAENYIDYSGKLQRAQIDMEFVDQEQV